MARILIPRGPCCSSKKVETTDFEKYFGNILDNHILCGLTLAAQCPAALAVDVASGEARLAGLDIASNATCCVPCLTMCRTNYIYAQLNRDAMCRPCNWTLITNLTGVIPTDAMLLGNAVTNTTTVTSVSSVPVAIEPKVGQTQTGNQVFPHSITIGDYTSPCCAFSTSGGGTTCKVLCEIGDWATQCIADTDWVPQCTTNIRGNITNCNIDFDIKRDCTNDSITHSLSCALSDTDWGMEFRLDLSTVTTPACSQNVGYFGMFGSNGATDASSNQDFIGIGLRVATCCSATFELTDKNCMALDTACSIEFCTTMTTCCSPYFIRIARNSSIAYYGEIYSCACYCMLTEKKCGVVSACVTGLQHVGIKNNFTGANCGVIIGTIDDIKVWDNGIGGRGCARLVVDCMDCTTWTSSCETNPAVYVDMGSVADMVGVSINHCCATTATILKIRTSTCTTFTDCDNVRTILETNLTSCMDNFIRFNRPSTDHRFLQIIAADDTSSVLSINEVKVLTPTDADRSHGHLIICSEDTSLIFDGT